MKYTNYLINGDIVSAKALENLPKIFLPFTLVVVILGVVLLAGAIPMTLSIDGIRTLKYEMVKFERKYHYGQTVAESKVVKYTIVKPIRVMMINPIHNVLKFVA